MFKLVEYNAKNGNISKIIVNEGVQICDFNHCDLTHAIVYFPESCEDVKNMIIKHLNMLVKEKGEYTAIREMRKHIGWYIKGFANASEIRKKVCEIEEISELKNVIENI